MMKVKRKLTKRGPSILANERRRLCWRRHHQRLVERRVKWFYQLCTLERDAKDRESES